MLLHIGGCLLMSLGLSCTAFVEVELPNTQLTRSHVFEDSKTAEAAMTQVYSSIRDEGLLTGTAYGLSNSLAVYTDAMDFYGNSSLASFSFYNNALLASNSSIDTYWSIAYNQIYAANTVYEGAGASTHLSLSDVESLQGEALFVRALIHFYLVNLYGDIPYVQTTDYLVNNALGRLEVSKVYDQILVDLEAAIWLLPQAYTTGNRTRPNQAVAQALMARIYLYQGQWDLAQDLATQVIDNALYTDELSVETLFLKASTETLWQLSPSTAGRHTHEASTFTLFSGPPTTSALTSDFMLGFSANDLRKTYWLGELSDGSSTWYFPKKYKQTSVEAVSTEYAIVFRLAEQYLIRAEARAQTGDLIGAASDLNHIRNRSGLEDTTAATAQELVTAILNERRFEFFTEYGHRFFDLKRLGLLDAVLGPLKSGWQTSDALFPIPEREIGVNPNILPQNTGY